MTDQGTVLDENGAKRRADRVIVHGAANAKAGLAPPTDATVTPAAVALTASTSAVLLVANTSRNRFRIYNPLATTLFVRLAASAASAAAGGYDIPIGAGQFYTSDPREYLGEIRGLCATAGSVTVSESV